MPDWHGERRPVLEPWRVPPVQTSLTAEQRELRALPRGEQISHIRTLEALVESLPPGKRYSMRETYLLLIKRRWFLEMLEASVKEVPGG